MIPEERRDELGRGHGHDESGRQRQAPGAHDQQDQRDRHTCPLDRGRRLGAEAGLVEDRPQREVVRRANGLADRPEQRHVIGPGGGADQWQGHETRDRDDAHRDGRRAPRPDEGGPPDEQQRLQLHESAQADRRAEGLRTIQPAPARDEQQQQDRPDLAELERVQDRPVQARQQQQHPAERRRDGHQGDRPDDARDEQPGPDPDPGRPEQRERHERDRERRRIQEDREATSEIDARVVERLPVDGPVRRVAGVDVVDPTGGERALRGLGSGRRGVHDDRAGDLRHVYSLPILRR